MRPSKSSSKNSHSRPFIIFLLFKALKKPRMWMMIARLMTRTCPVTWFLLKNYLTVEEPHPVTSRLGTKSSTTSKSTPFKTSTYTFTFPNLRTSLYLNPKFPTLPLLVPKHPPSSTTFSMNTHKNLLMSSSRDSWKTFTDANL